MALHIAFEKSADTWLKKIVRAFAGPYVHTEIIVTQHEPVRAHTAYSAYVYENFSRTPEKDFEFSDERHDFLYIPVTPEESKRISQTCEACVLSKIPYNTSDMILSQLPLRNPTECDIFHTGTLFCSQAVVLVLRSCLDKTHPLQDQLNTINSRVISPTQIYNLLLPYATPRTQIQVFR